MWGGVGGRRASEFLNGICFFNDKQISTGHNIFTRFTESIIIPLFTPINSEQTYFFLETLYNVLYIFLFQLYFFCCADDVISLCSFIGTTIIYENQ